MASLAAGLEGYNFETDHNSSRGQSDATRAIVRCGCGGHCHGRVQSASRRSGDRDLQCQSWPQHVLRAGVWRLQHLWRSDCLRINHPSSVELLRSSLLRGLRRKRLVPHWQRTPLLLESARLTHDVPCGPPTDTVLPIGALGSSIGANGSFNPSENPLARAHQDALSA